MKYLQLWEEPPPVDAGWRGNTSPPNGCLDVMKPNGKFKRVYTFLDKPHQEGKLYIKEKEPGYFVIQYWKSWFMVEFMMKAFGVGNYISASRIFTTLKIESLLVNNPTRERLESILMYLYELRPSSPIAAQRAVFAFVLYEHNMDIALKMRTCKTAGEHSYWSKELNRLARLYAQIAKHE